jgi:hypothetical protein
VAVVQRRLPAICVVFAVAAEDSQGNGGRLLYQNRRIGCVEGQRKPCCQFLTVCVIKRGFLKPWVSGYDGSRDAQKAHNPVRSRNHEQIVFKVSKSV